MGYDPSSCPSSSCRPDRFRGPLLILGLAAALAPVLTLPSAFDPAESPQRLLIQSAVLTALALAMLQGADGASASSSWPVGGPILTLAVWATLSLTWTSDLCSGVAAVAAWWTFWAALVVATHLARHRGAARLLLAAVFLSAVVCAAVGLAQDLFGLSWYPQAVAPGGTLVNRALAAEYVAIAFPLTFAVIGLTPRWGLLELAAALGGLLIESFVVVSGSRAATLALIAAGGVVILPRGGWLRSTRARGLGTAFVVVLCLAPVALALNGSRWSSRWRSGLDAVLALSESATEAATGPSSDGAESVTIRLVIWRNTLRLIAARPLTGTGLGGFAAEYPRVAAAAPRSDQLSPLLEVEHPHNEALKLAAELGAVGSALCLWLAWQLISLAWRWLQKGQAHPGEAGRGAALAATVAFLVVAGFSLPLRLSAVQLSLAIVLGVLQASPQPVVPRRAAAAVASPIPARWRWAASGVTVALALGLLAWNSLRLAAGIELLGAVRAATRQDWDLSQAAAGRAARCDPCSRKARSLMGLALLRGGRPTAAVEALQGPAQRWPTSVPLVGNLGAALLASGRFGEAVEPLRAVLRLEPSSKRARILLATATGFSQSPALSDASTEDSDASTEDSPEPQPACPSRIHVRVEGGRLGLAGEGTLKEFLACLAGETGLKWSAEDESILGRGLKIDVPLAAATTTIAQLLEGLGVDYAIAQDPTGRQVRVLLLLASSSPQPTSMPSRSPYTSGVLRPGVPRSAEPAPGPAGGERPEVHPDAGVPPFGGVVYDGRRPPDGTGPATPQPESPDFPEPRPLTLSTLQPP
jgi:O-antigen ligase